MLRRAAERYAGRIRFIGVNVEDARDSATAFAKRFRLPYPSGFDPKREIMRHLKILGLPTTLFFKPDGELALVHSGEIDAAELQSKIEDVLRLTTGGDAS